MFEESQVTVTFFGIAITVNQNNTYFSKIQNKIDNTVREDGSSGSQTLLVFLLMAEFHFHPTGYKKVGFARN
jgi:hypothetical protein